MLPRLISAHLTNYGQLLCFCHRIITSERLLRPKTVSLAGTSGYLSPGYVGICDNSGIA
jgi:hypothetical protein